MKIKSLLVLGLVAGLSACAVSGHHSANVYSGRQVQNEQSVRYAYVESIREVQIDKGRSGNFKSTSSVLFCAIIN